MIYRSISEIRDTKELCVVGFTLREVWKIVILIIMEFGELLISPRIVNGLRSHITHSKGCLIRFPNTEKWVEKTEAH